jgi:hypothetical protein
MVKKAYMRRKVVGYNPKPHGFDPRYVTTGSFGF